MHPRPLCVDLDNSLLNTDLIFEFIIEKIKKNPINIFRLFKYLLINRKDLLKEWLVTESEFDWENIPKNLNVVNFLENEAKNGRTIIIVTGAHQKLASKIKGIFPFITEVVGTANGINLIGKNKANYLCNRFNKQGFDYLGDSPTDLIVWECAHDAYVVSNNKQLIKKVKNNKQVFHTTRNSLKNILKGIRSSQWVKNLLLFLPAILSHNFYDIKLFFHLILGVCYFSLAASAVYLINDILDISSDRLHRTKRERPIANGNLDIVLALKIILSFLSISLVGAYYLNSTFLLILIIYFISNLAYSMHFKKTAIFDVFLLSSFYLIRIAAGGVIGGIILSSWLKSFSFFLFLNLGFLKRYTEALLNYQKQGLTSSSGRAYIYQDLGILQSFGVASAYISVLVLSLYIYQGQVNLLYKDSEYMWGIVLLLLYWVTSLWYKASHGRVKDDPVKYIISDNESIVVFVLALICFYFAII